MDDWMWPDESAGGELLHPSQIENVGVQLDPVRQGIVQGTARFYPSPEAIAEVTSLLAPGDRRR
ncbi:hypothetical protein [Streptomyces sp. NPDC047725]|uniref:hypothetical protein n=1 Tax=Streptomyces sp. NPDC047725 TaxID=3365487 RepID=UPI00371E2891